MLPKICSIPECEKPAKGRGWCQAHYRLWRLQGDANWKRLTAAERFWSKVDKTDTCWNWTGAPNSGGYGQFLLDGKQSMVHRLTFESVNGPIPDGMQIDHMCHNKTCVNPEHLRIVNNKQNAENRAGVNSNNASGVLGVHKHPQTGKWRVQIMSNGRLVHIGLFESLNDAEQAAIDKRNELFQFNDLDRINA